MTTPGKVEASLAEVSAAEVGRATSAWELVKAQVEALPSSETIAPNVDMQAAGSVILGWVKRLQEHDLAPRLARLSEIGEVEADLLIQAETLAWAAIHVRRRQLGALVLGSDARVSTADDSASRLLRERMLRVLDYQLADEREEIPALLAQIREGTGYLDRANDLEALAELYEAHATTLARDGKRYRPGDAAEARRLAEVLFRAVGDAPGNEAAQWTGRAMRVWPLLLRAAASLRRVGLFLLPGEAGEQAFPALAGVARARPRSRDTTVAPDATPKPDGL